MDHRSTTGQRRSSHHDSRWHHHGDSADTAGILFDDDAGNLTATRIDVTRWDADDLQTHLERQFAQGGRIMIPTIDGLATVDLDTLDGHQRRTVAECMATRQLGFVHEVDQQSDRRTSDRGLEESVDGRDASPTEQPDEAPAEKSGVFTWLYQTARSVASALTVKRVKKVIATALAVGALAVGVSNGFSGCSTEEQEPGNEVMIQVDYNAPITIHEVSIDGAAGMPSAHEGDAAHKARVFERTQQFFQDTGTSITEADLRSLVNKVSAGEQTPADAASAIDDACGLGAHGTKKLEDVLSLWEKD